MSPSVAISSPSRRGGPVRDPSWTSTLSLSSTSSFSTISTSGLSSGSVNIGGSSSSSPQQSYLRANAFLIVYVSFFGSFLLLNLNMFRVYHASFQTAEQANRRLRQLQSSIHHLDNNSPLVAVTAPSINSTKKSSLASSSSLSQKENATTNTNTQEMRLQFANSLSDRHSLCRASYSRNYAPASELPAVSISRQRKLAMGGYDLIAKGSGNVIAAGIILNRISHMQHSAQIFGSVGELGVHHGRFTSFLFVSARQTEPLIVADLFNEHQDENVDLSGHGDYKQFLKGLRTYGVSQSQLHTIYHGNTAQLPLDWSIQQTFAPFRLISVDASHTTANTRRDLSLAFCNLLEGGVIVLDDWFHASWPGVVEGYYQFVHDTTLFLPSSSPPAVFPFLICESKLYFTNSREWHQKYYQALRNNPHFTSLMTPYSFDKGEEKGQVLYEMNQVNYLRCTSRANMTVSQLQQQWVDHVY